MFTLQDPQLVLLPYNVCFGGVALFEHEESTTNQGIQFSNFDT